MACPKPSGRRATLAQGPSGTAPLWLVKAALPAMTGCVLPTTDERVDSSVLVESAATETSGVLSDSSVAGAIADRYVPDTQVPFGHDSWAYHRWIQSCASGFGIEVELSASDPGNPPGMLAKITSTQRERWLEVEGACAAAAEGRGWLSPKPSTDEELRTEYQRLVEVNECLMALGFGSEPPSEEAFVDGARWDVYAATPFGSELSLAPTAGPWVPRDVVDQLDIQAACPRWEVED